MMPDERRLYQIENGTVYYYHDASHPVVICQENELFAVVWDSAGDILQTHGKADQVEDRLAHMRQAFIMGGFEGLAASLMIATFPATPETLEEMNACIEISNRVGKLEERLAQMVVPRSATMH
jgi:hypothetical protein